MNILIKPIITEKATRNAEDLNCFTFVVNPRRTRLKSKMRLNLHMVFQLLQFAQLMSAQIVVFVKRKRESKLVKQMQLRRQLYRWRKVIQ